MATLSLVIAGPNVGNYNFTVELPDAQAARILSWGGATQGPVTEDVNGVPTQRARTPQEVVDGIAEGFLSGTLANVHRWERESAEAAARASLPPAIEPVRVTP
jgi:hypothetical protein